MRTSLRVVGATCVAVLVLPACTSSSADPADDESETSVPTPTASPSSSEQLPASPSATASVEDTFAVPDPVTEEYVDRVVNRLYEEWGAIIRGVLEQPADPGSITGVETREQIAALFADEYLLDRISEADERLRGDREGLLPADAFGQVRFTTRKVLASSNNCLVVAGEFDTSETSTSPDSILVALSLSKGAGSVPPYVNWRIIDGLANTGRGGEVLPDSVMLEASLEDFGDLLTTTCES